MTIEDFVDLVWNMAKTEGTPYIKRSEQAKLMDLCQEMLNVYASETECLQADNVTFTPVVNRSSYQTFVVPQELGRTTIPDQFSAALCRVRQVYVDGAPLGIAGDLLSRPGASSEYQISRLFPTYLVATNDCPRHWWSENPNTLRFNCPFDQVYSNCWVSGRLYHSPLLAFNQVLDLPPEDIEPAATLACSRLLSVYSRERSVALRAICDAQMQGRLKACAVKMTGNEHRGTYNSRVEVNLGR